MDIKGLEQFIEKTVKEFDQYTSDVFPRNASCVGLDFVEDNFRKQGYDGTSFEPWSQTQKGMNILNDKAQLRNSNVSTLSSGSATIRNVQPYAQIHNEGGRVNIPINERMRKYFWAMYYQNGGGKTKKGNAETEKWKALALTKEKVISFTMPRRQFFPTETNPSDALKQRMEEAIVSHFNQLTKR